MFYRFQAHKNWFSTQKLVQLFMELIDSNGIKFEQTRGYSTILVYKENSDCLDIHQ